MQTRALKGDGRMNEGESRFTWQMAVVDALPVLFFGIAAMVLGKKLSSVVLVAGAAVCVLAGAGKVAWKLLIALAEKDVPVLGSQLRFLMPVGFVLMIAGAATSRRDLLLGLAASALSLPSLAFFVLAAVGICGMVACARRFDRYDVRGNWIEQCINAAAQGCLLLGVLFL